MKKVIILFCLGISTKVFAGCGDVPGSDQITPNDNATTISKKICDCSEKFVSNLNKENKENNLDFKDEMNQLRPLIAKKKVLEDAKKVVDEYLSKFKEIIDPIKGKNSVNNQIASYNNTINQAMMLHSMKEVILKNKSILDYKNFDFVDFCLGKYKDLPVNDSMRFTCDQQNAIAKKQYVFNETNFSKAFTSLVKLYQTASNDSNANLDVELNNILKKIPDAAAPELTLKLAEQNSKSILNKLASFEMQNCLAQNASNITPQCEEKYKTLSPESNQDIKAELASLPSLFKDQVELSKVYDESQQHKLMAADQKLNDLLGKKLEEAYSTLMNPPSQNEIFDAFKKAGMVMSDARVQAAKLDQHLKTQFGPDQYSFLSSLDSYGRECGNPETIKKKVSNPKTLDAEIEKCSQYIENIALKFKDADQTLKDLNAKIDELSNSMKAKMNSDKARSNHKLQNYLANKWYRECSQFQNRTEPTVIQGCLNDPFSEVTRFKIGDTFYPIIGKISAPYRRSSSFSASEMRDYADNCKTVDQKNPMNKLICTSIENDMGVSKEEKTSQEWLDIKEKNYVVYDNNAPAGYRLVPKKSTRSIIGSSLLTGLVYETPYFINNMMARSSIDYMEQQAMAQKQWMWNMNQANNYWLNNLFYSPLSSGTSSTFTMPTTLNGSTYSYNFGAN